MNYKNKYYKYKLKYLLAKKKLVGGNNNLGGSQNSSGSISNEDPPPEDPPPVQIVLGTPPRDPFYVPGTPESQLESDEPHESPKSPETSVPPPKKMI